MLLTEDKLAQWVKSKNGLLMTRSIFNINEYEFHNISSPKYVCITGYKEVIDMFFNKFIHYFHKGVILIIIESDVIPIQKSQLEHKNILHCFTWNKPYHHEKMTAIPIGLNYNRQYIVLDNWLKNHQNQLSPQKMLCFNCSLNTDASRQLLLNHAKQNWYNFCTLLDYIPSLNSYVIPSYIEGQLQIHVTNPVCYGKWSNFKFVLSPRGAGIDCHRTWEVLATGRIPIVLSSFIDEIYQDLPVVVVNDWNQINQTFLQQQYDIYLQKINDNAYNMDKINIHYWTNYIQEKMTLFEKTSMK